MDSECLIPEEIGNLTGIMTILEQRESDLMEMSTSIHSNIQLLEITVFQQRLVKLLHDTSYEMRQIHPTLQDISTQLFALKREGREQRENMQEMEEEIGSSRKNYEEQRVENSELRGELFKRESCLNRMESECRERSVSLKDARRRLEESRIECGEYERLAQDAEGLRRKIGVLEGNNRSLGEELRVLTEKYVVVSNTLREIDSRQLPPGDLRDSFSDRRFHNSEITQAEVNKALLYQNSGVLEQARETLLSSNASSKELDLGDGYSNLQGTSIPTAQGSMPIPIQERMNYSEMGLSSIRQASGSKADDNKQLGGSVGAYDQNGEKRHKVYIMNNQGASKVSREERESTLREIDKYFNFLGIRILEQENEISETILGRIGSLDDYYRIIEKKEYDKAFLQSLKILCDFSVNSIGIKREEVPGDTVLGELSLSHSGVKSGSGLLGSKSSEPTLLEERNERRTLYQVETEKMGEPIVVGAEIPQRTPQKMTEGPRSPYSKAGGELEYAELAAGTPEESPEKLALKMKLRSSLEDYISSRRLREVEGENMQVQGEGEGENMRENMSQTQLREKPSVSGGPKPGSPHFGRENYKEVAGVEQRTRKMGGWSSGKKRQPGFMREQGPRTAGTPTLYSKISDFPTHLRNYPPANEKSKAKSIYFADDPKMKQIFTSYINRFPHYFDPPYQHGGESVLTATNFNKDTSLSKSPRLPQISQTEFDKQPLNRIMNAKDMQRGNVFNDHPGWESTREYFRHSGPDTPRNRTRSPDKITTPYKEYEEEEMK